MRLALFHILFFCLCFAQARAADFIKATDNYANPVQIRIIPKAECISRLENLFSPKNAVAEALAALEQANSHSAAAQCLSEYVEESRRTLDGILVPLPPDWPGAAPAFPQAKMYRMNELHGKLACFNDRPKGSIAFEKYKASYEKLCAGKWLSKAEGEELRQEDAALRKEFAELQQYATELNSLAGQIADLFTAPYRRDEKTHKDLNLKVDCYNPNEPGSESYQRVIDYAGAKCAGLWQTKEQREKASKELAAFNKQDDLANQAWKAERGKSTGYIQSELQKSGDSLEKIRAELKAGKIRARFSDFNADREKWNKKYEARVQNFPKEKQAALDRQLAIYDQARLMAKFSAHLRSGGDAVGFADFCGSYEKDQQRDAELAQSGIRITMFSIEKDWRYARNYGLSEGEFSAIREYTAGSWDKINHALRYPKELTANLKLFKAAIDSGLDRLPVYHGDPVVRLDMPLPEVLNTFQKDALVRYDAYTSTSKDPEWTNNPEGLPNHTFTFRLHTRGRDIEDLSAHPAEAEVLVKAGTVFKVISRDPDPRNHTLLHFELEEVEGGEANDKK